MIRPGTYHSPTPVVPSETPAREAALRIGPIDRSPTLPPERGEGIFLRQLRDDALELRLVEGTHAQGPDVALHRSCESERRHGLVVTCFYDYNGVIRTEGEVVADK